MRAALLMALALAPLLAPLLADPARARVAPAHPQHAGPNPASARKEPLVRASRPEAARPVSAPAPAQAPVLAQAAMPVQAAVPVPSEAIPPAKNPPIPHDFGVPASLAQFQNQPQTPLLAQPGAQSAAQVEPVAKRAILLPAGRDAGLAAFRSGGETLIVLDAAIDFQTANASLAFPGLTSRRTEDATVIRIPDAGNSPAGNPATGSPPAGNLGAPPSPLRLARDPRGWVVTAADPDGASAGAPAGTIARIQPQLVESTAVPGLANAVMRFAVAEPSRVVTIVDPQTGSRLLVGTQGSAGQAIAASRMQVQFNLPATLQGIVVAPKSDDIQLRREPGGFVLSADPRSAGGIISGTPPHDPATPAAPPLSRLFDLPNDATQVLYRKLNDQIRFAASAPSLSRSAPRRRVAETMVALGMGAEAQSVLDVAATDDPGLRENPEIIGLRAAASVLAHRLEAAGTLADPRLTGTAEIELWRALLHVELGQATGQDARGLSAALPLVLAYPRPLRERLLPGTLEAMALHGRADAAQAALKTLPDDRTLDLARGMALEMIGQPAAALRAYDDVAGRPDRLPRYKALLRAVELRMKGGEPDAKPLDAKAAADALERSLFGWRGARQEFSLRLRVAGLRRDAGQWLKALAMLRETRTAFPEDRPQVDQEIAATFTALFTGDAAQRIPAAEFVAFFDRNIDLVTNMTWTEPLGLKLADHLIALNLQGRAEPVMARLAAQSTDPARRAFLGMRLAALRMTMDDPAGAIAALAGTAPEGGDRPADRAVADRDVAGRDVAGREVMDTRQFLYARAEAARGNKDVALSMLDQLRTPDADELRADIYAARKDWPRAIAALAAVEGKRIPAAAGSSTPPLTEPQTALVMRLAEAATLGGDAATLARLQASYGAGMAQGGSAGLFRLITSAPVKGTADLPRAFEEIKLARQLPAEFGARAPASGPP